MTTGSTIARFTITLSKSVAEPVQVAWSTKDGTAKAGIDYAAASGTAVFSPGETNKDVDVLVYGRAVGTEDRNFFLEMTPPPNAILGESIGECIIYLDTAGNTAVIQVIVPTGPQGDKGDSAYQSWLNLGNTGTEQDFIDSLSPPVEEIAAEVAPLLDVSNSPLTAEGTETLSKPDTMTGKRLARRVAYVGAAKVATLILADGDNLITHADLSGDAVDFNSISLYPRILRGAVVISPEWSVEPGDKILIKSAVAGDVLHVCQYDVISDLAVKNRLDTVTKPLIEQVREALIRVYAEAGYTLVDGSFEEGGTLNNASEALLHYLTGKAYYGAGPFPQGVSEGTDPLSGGFTSVEIKNAYVGNYTGLRRYAGAASLVYITGVLPTAKPDGVAGFFVYDATDTTSTDDGGTVIVGDDGRRWKRQYNGIPSVLWWGAKPDWNGVTGTDNTAALQAAHNAHAVLFYPYGSYKTGSITLTKFGATLVGPGELYGSAELAYTGSGTLFTCTAGVSYVQFKSGMFLHGIPAVATDYYNTGSIAIDTTAGSTSLIFDGSWVNGFEILFNSNYNSFYNRFTNNRLERFRIGLNKFSHNNLHIEKNRISRFNTALVVNGANGPLVIDKNAFEVFNGPIASMTGVEQGEIVFTNNYVELYDSFDLPTNFPASAAPNTTKFGGNILFTGPIGSFKQSGNDLQIGGCFRLMTASLHVDVIESVGNNIHTFTTGNNLDRMWVAPSVGSININDRLGITQGTGGYSRTYAGSPLAQLDPNRPYFFYDCIAGKSFRAKAETFALALLNGWTNPDANHGVARVHKKDGEVRLSGVIDGTANTGIVAFNVPVAYRPDEVGNTRAYANFSCFSAYGGGTVVRLRYLYSTGDLRLEGSPESLAGVSLDGIIIPVRT